MEYADMNQVVGVATHPVVTQVWRLADPLCQGEGMELIHVEFQREPGGRILRLYIDRPGGVTLDDCVSVSRQLSDLLDVALDTPGAYRMEVSSPGARRPLGKRIDFHRFQGYQAKVRTAQPIKGRKNFTGTLQGASGTAIRMAVDNQEMEIGFADIVKAHLISFNGENAC